MDVTHTAIVLSVERYMRTKSEAALAYFVSLNPNCEGAQWADILDDLLSENANLEITEPTYELMKPVVPILSLPWVVPVTLTLLYAHNGNPPYTVEVCYWHGFVMGMIEAKGL